MKSSDTINAKEIRKDLEGFLKRVKTGKPLTVIYRSRPYVTINAPVQSRASDAPGSSAAMRRSIAAAKLLRESAGASVSSEYHELLEQKYGKN